MTRREAPFFWEPRGRAFYGKAAESPADPGVGEVFRAMAEGERSRGEAPAMHYSPPAGNGSGPPGKRGIL